MTLRELLRSQKHGREAVGLAAQLRSLIAERDRMLRAEVHVEVDSAEAAELVAEIGEIQTEISNMTIKLVGLLGGGGETDD